eukprot:scaffold16302_cov136-Isochrysis_galbana.AAC.2
MHHHATTTPFVAPQLPISASASSGPSSSSATSSSSCARPFRSLRKAHTAAATTPRFSARLPASERGVRSVRNPPRPAISRVTDTYAAIDAPAMVDG